MQATVFDFRFELQDRRIMFYFANTTQMFAPFPYTVKRFQPRFRDFKFISYTINEKDGESIPDSGEEYYSGKPTYNENRLYPFGSWGFGRLFGLSRDSGASYSPKVLFRPTKYLDIMVVREDTNRGFWSIQTRGVVRSAKYFSLLGGINGYYPIGIMPSIYQPMGEEIVLTSIKARIIEDFPIKYSASGSIGSVRNTYFYHIFRINNVIEPKDKVEGRWLRPFSIYSTLQPLSTTYNVIDNMGFMSPINIIVETTYVDTDDIIEATIYPLVTYQLDRGEFNSASMYGPLNKILINRED